MVPALVVIALSCTLGFAPVARAGGSRPPQALPNFVILLSDDQGWGDVAYNGHPALRTPNLDGMARAGVRFDRLYAAAPLCSPTRAGVLTGRHPYRYGIHHAEGAVLPPSEITIAEVLRDRGYATGHFGKWHLGAFEESDPGWPASPPWEHGFETCFSTPGSLPTWDPLSDPETGEDSGARYWTGPGEPVSAGCEGDASRVLVDRVLEFAGSAVRDDRPFLAVLWFHAPHFPVLAGAADRMPYRGASEAEQHYWGTLTAMDREIGRLRRWLAEAGLAGETALLFASDNGPVRTERDDRAPPAGSTGFFRGEKGGLLEGGIRVPGVLVWPARAGAPRAIGDAWSLLDWFPTMLDAVGESAPRLPIDGVSLWPRLEPAQAARGQAIAFRSGQHSALVDGCCKVITANGGTTWQLYDVETDPGEAHDLASERPDVLAGMRRVLDRARTTWTSSARGGDE